MVRRLKRVAVVLAHVRHSHAPALLAGLHAVPCEPIVLDMAGPWPSDLDTYLVYGPGTSLASMVEQLKGVRAPKPNVIVWLTEQTPSPDVSTPVRKFLADTLWSGDQSLARLSRTVRVAPLGRWLRLLEKRAVRLRILGVLRWLQREGYLRLLAVLTPSHQRFFARMGVPAVVVPFGYHPSFGAPLALERDIDAVFIGSLNDRRRAHIIRALQSELDRRKVRFVIKDGRTYGDDRTRLLNRSQIMLNIMRQPWDDLVFRMLLAAPNGALLLSEPVVDSEPFIPCEHFAVSALAQIPDRVEYYLHHHDERDCIVQRAREYVLRQFSITDMARQLLDAAHSI